MHTLLRRPLLLSTVALLAAGQAPAQRPDTTLVAPANSSSGEPKLAVHVVTSAAPGQSITRSTDRPVRGSDGRELGRVKDVVADAYSGRVAYAAIAAQRDGAVRLVPFGVLVRDDESPAFEVRLDARAWESLPPVNGQDFADGRITISPTERRQLDERFGSAASSSTPAQAAGDADAAPTAGAATGGSQLVRLDELRGKRVSTGSEEIGTIEDIVIDAARRTATAVIAPEGNFARGDRKYVVPLRALNLAARDRNPITTALTRTDFEQARPVEPTIARGRPADEKDPPPPAPTGRTRATDASASGAVAAARTAIEQALAGDAQSRVEVAEDNGRLTLRGSVRDNATRERLERAVREAARGTPVHNELRVEQR